MTLQPNMKGVGSVSVSNGADHGKATDSIEQVIAYYERGTAALLFVAGLGVKVEIYDVSLLKDLYHTSRPLGLPQETSGSSKRPILSTGFP